MSGPQCKWRSDSSLLPIDGQGDTIDEFTRNDRKAQEAWENICHGRSRSRIISFFPSKCGFGGLSTNHLNVKVLNNNIFWDAEKRKHWFHKKFVLKND